MSDPTTRESLIAEALRLLDLANALPDEPPPERDHTDNPVHAATIQAYSDASALRSYVYRVSDDAPLYPTQDGPGSGKIVEVTVRLMVGTERSTVIVCRGRDPATLHEVREHGREAEGIGAAVEAAVRDGLIQLATAG